MKTCFKHLPSLLFISSLVLSACGTGQDLDLQLHQYLPKPQHKHQQIHQPRVQTIKCHQSTHISLIMRYNSKCLKCSLTMKSTPTTKQPNHTWPALFDLTVFSAYFYAFMEWLFFATKSSSLSVLTPLENGIVLAVTGGVVALLLVISLLVLSLPAWLVRNGTWRSRLQILGHLVPALMLSVTALVMFDNFTYTVFNFGIVSTQGAWRALYVLGFVLFAWWMLRFVQRTIKKESQALRIFPGPGPAGRFDRCYPGHQPHPGCRSGKFQHPLPPIFRGSP